MVNINWSKFQTKEELELADVNDEELCESIKAAKKLLKENGVDWPSLNESDQECPQGCTSMEYTFKDMHELYQQAHDLWEQYCNSPSMPPLLRLDRDAFVVYVITCLAEGDGMFGEEDDDD